MDFSEHSKKYIVYHYSQEYDLTLNQSKDVTVEFLSYYLDYLIQYHPLKEEMIRLKKVIGYLEELGNLDEDRK